MPLKKIQEYTEREQKPETLKQYLIEQSDDINRQIDVLLSRKNFLLCKLKAVRLRELMQMLTPRIVTRKERKVFVKNVTFQDYEEVMLTLRKMVKEGKNIYDTTMFLIRDFDPNNLDTDDLKQVKIGIDCAFKSADSALILPAGKYAEVIYENRLGARGKAREVFLEFLKQSGLVPKGYLIFTGTILNMVSVKSDAYCFTMEIRLTNAVDA
jgi:effector-binding domain-containing protein